MKTYIREFETAEARVTLINTGNRNTAKIQRYKEDNTLPCISLSIPQKIELCEYDNAITISEKIQKQLNLTDCYDLNDWRAI